MNRTRIHPRQKARSARRTNRALAKGLGKRGSRLYQTIDLRSANMLIAQTRNRIPTLLISTDPQHIGTGSCIFLRF